MLLNFPLEVLHTIISKVTNRKDLKQLCEVCKVLYSVATPILYETVTVTAQDEQFLSEINVEPLLRASYRPINLHHFTRALQITSRFHTNIVWRCIHTCDPDSGWQDEGDLEDGEEMEVDEVEDEIADENDMAEDEEQQRSGGDKHDDYERQDSHKHMKELTRNLMPLLKRCKDGCLRSFSWELGTCIPRSILGPLGYLPRKQSGIESIHLITDGSCSWEVETQIVLSVFKHLKRLSWRGLSSSDHFRSLRETLQQSSHQFVELELDLINRDLTALHVGDEYEKYDNFFAGYVLQLTPGSRKQFFPALKVLSLSAVSFKAAEKEMANAFDFSMLRSLKLRFCPGWEDFLEEVSHSQQQINLRCLEIQSDNSTFDPLTKISKFVELFDGLEEIFLSINSIRSPSQTLVIWRSALHHKSSLRRFVYHHRAMDFDDDLLASRQTFDVPNLSLHPEDFSELVDKPSENPLSHLDLECIGLCCHPRFLMAVLIPLASKLSLQLLHIRQSGSDLEHCASWAVNRDDDWDALGSESDVPKPRTSQSDQNKSGNSRSFAPDASWKISEALHNFAQWAFGPRGLPSLQLIAVGDFSYKGRFSRGNVLLCKRPLESTPVEQNGDASSKNYYRLLTDSDRSLWDLLNKHSDFLEACPTESLFRYQGGYF